MVGHEWFYWILSLFSPSQWVELNSTHWRSEFFVREERIQWNYSCATIRISHKQFLAKYFAVVESGLQSSRRWHEAHVEGRFRPASHCTTLLATVAYNSLTTGSVQCKAYFPLGEFVRANRQKSRNACSQRIFSPANFNQSCCRILVFASRRAKKVDPTL